MTKRSSRPHPRLATEPDQAKAGLPQQTRGARLDPEAATLLRLISLAERKTITRESLQRKRLAWRLSAQTLGRGAAVAQVASVRIPGPAGPIELRLYYPNAMPQPAPAFIWFHGGGFMLGGLASADAICRQLALSSGAVVIAARYRLAPEHDLYAGREDCMAVVDWVAREGHAHGIDVTRLAVGGDSAGGNLAAAVAQRALERGAPALRMQVLVYPATNLRDDFPSKSENARGFLLTSDGMDAIKALLKEQEPDLSDPWLSPSLRDDFPSKSENARGFLLTSDGMDAIKALLKEQEPDLSDPWLSPSLRADLQGLPPALILTAGFDPIRDDGLAYAERLRDADVPVELLHYTGQFHGFLNFDGVLRAARDALERIGAALRHALQEAPTGAPPPAVDRTLELTMRAQEASPGPDLGIGHHMLIAGLMLGERLEAWRCDMARYMLPRGSLVADLVASPWFNPVTACRTHVAQKFAAIEVHETYRGGAAD